MSHIDDDISGGLTNGNYGRLPHEAMNRLNLNGGAGSEGSAPRRGDDGTEDGSDNFVENPLYGRGTFAQDQGLAPEYILLHRVICDNRAADGEDHQDHPAQSDYLDVPRLFKNDTRGSALRGAKPLLNPREFWEDHPEVSAIVTREYRCGSYHRQLKGSFRIIAQVADRQTRNRLRPWLYRLDDDGPPAVNPTESITISETLSASLMTLALGNQLGEWSQERDLMAPYDYFYHFRESLRRSSQLQLPTWDRQELEVLLDYIDETQGKKFDKVDDVFAHGQVHRDIFSKLFRPNELVVTNQEGHPRAYIAEKVYMNDRRAALERPTITLECWAWEFDGSFRKKTTQLQVSWPQTHHATISVTSLLAWPLRLEKPEMEKRLEDRGKEFWTCRKRRLISYYSPTPTIFELQVTNPKYMIDYSTHRQMHPNKFSQQLVPKDEMLDDGVDIDSDEPPKYPFCMLLPPTMLGYAFHDKKWRSLSIEHVRDVPWNFEAFNRLVLKQTKKDTIKALVTVHLTTVQNVDVVENKGNGLIILLHGSPGTGKTLTAESVAEIAKKPLYRVTCGDIGTDAESVEKYMESVLLIGTIWQCVVLLDEADVFLEERQVTDLARNALVSVFLRVLEYYDGILILTTNRVGTFDEAFKSRIQLAVHYPPLDKAGRLKIWTSFIKILNKRGVAMDYEGLMDQVDVWAKIPFNGRQIRNNLWTAAQVAKYHGSALEPKHLEEVVEISQEFEEYLLKTKGHSDEEYARNTGVRDS